MRVIHNVSCPQGNLHLVWNAISTHYMSNRCHPSTPAATVRRAPASPRPRVDADKHAAREPSRARWRTAERHNWP